MDQDDGGTIDDELKFLQRENQRLQNANLQKELSRKINWTVALPLLAAVIGLVPPAYIAVINARTQIATERLKAETTLIVAAVKTNNPEQGFKNLMFFIRSGKLPDPDHLMANQISEGQGPSLIPPPALLACPTRGPLVWVNTRTGHYHLPGEKWFGTTIEGKYLCQADADGAGYKPAPNPKNLPPP